MIAIGGEGGLLGRRPFGHDGADLARGPEQGAGLGRDHPQIGVLAGTGVVGGDQLLHLALGDHRRGGGQDLEHAQAAIGDHELEGAAEQEVADQHRRLVAPDGVRGGRAAPEPAVVDHVVVQQGGGVDELDAGGQRQLPRAAIAAQSRREQREDRPDPLAAGGDDVARQLRDQADFALHPVEDDPVHLVELDGDERANAVELRSGALRRQWCCRQRRQPGVSSARCRCAWPTRACRLLSRAWGDSKPAPGLPNRHSRCPTWSN